MNERIKRLADEAGDYVNSVYTPPVRSKTPGKIWEDGHVDWHTQFNQKFAELIVQKCADIGEQYADGNYEVRNQILEHFGVEE